MRVLFYLIQKEFLQILRNRAMIPMMTVLPLVQLMLLANAASNEVKNVNVSVADQSQSQSAARLKRRIAASDRVTIVGDHTTAVLAYADLEIGRADIVLNIDRDFDADLKSGLGTEVQILANAINGQTAIVGSGYVAAIIKAFDRNLSAVPRAGPALSLHTQNWFNPKLDYKVFMVPGILGQLVTILVLLLTAMNIVREREIGTIEQINVTPIKRWQFIVGKMVPFFIIGMAMLSVGLIAGRVVFDVPIRGSLAVVLVYCALNVTAVLGMGLLISNFADTQQQAILIAFFFVITFVLMGGLFTPIESMPDWAQVMSWPNPIAHFVAVMRAVLLKGASAPDIFPHAAATAAIAIVTNTLAVLTFKKQS